MTLYTFFTILGIAAGGAVAWQLRLPKRERRMSLGFFLSAVAGIVIGAKLPLLLTHGVRPEILYTGKSFLGGLVGAFIAINAYKLATRQMASSFGGRFVIPLAVAAGFGKIGCYFNGCCGGHIRDIPVQFVESAFQFCAAVGLYLFYRVHTTPYLSSDTSPVNPENPVNPVKKSALPARGDTAVLPVLFPLYLVAYLAMRFAVEFVRDEPRGALGLTLYQWIALAVIPFGLGILYHRRNPYDRTA